MRCFRVSLKDEFPILGENGCNPFIDCYLPYNTPEVKRESYNRPCMVVLPGGGYGMCSEREAEPIALQFLSMGFNVFTLNYSVNPHRYPTQLREVAAVLELIYKNAEEWNCNTERIGVIGFSAGGHLCAHYSNAYYIDEVREIFPDSKRPFCSILCYPVIPADENITHKGSIKNLSGIDYPQGAEADKFSCEKLVTADTPQAFIWHTAADQAVPVRSSLAYAGALADNKIPFELHIYPYGRHGLSTADWQTYNIGDLLPEEEYAHEWLSSLKKWIELTF